MSSASITVTLSIIYGFPSVFLYILTIIIIQKNKKKFDSSFFNLYVFDGFMNMFTYLNVLFTSRLSSVTCDTCLLAPVYRNVGRFISLNFVLAMLYHMAYVQYSITVLVSLNRLSVLLKSHVFEPIWKKYTWLFIILIYFLPFLNTKIVFYYETEITYFDDIDQYSLISRELPVTQIFSILIPFMILAMSLTIFFNIASVIFLRGLNIQRKQTESKFLLITIITCGFQLVGTIISVPLSLLEVSPVLMKLSLILPFTSDGLSLVQPWLLLCFSAAVSAIFEETYLEILKRNQKVVNYKNVLLV
ncbi:hypothetical protein CRE_04328 [Caenorhabditis remanei]|uniref:Serpentine receptor class gamma n=1 Tax=Caenorhabditis remanei TaxID=31234 RepID=E3NGR3_CAERE|nr:hypothetical protein CRE_04328 [Caenorhabditis remanei]